MGRRLGEVSQSTRDRLQQMKQFYEANGHSDIPKDYAADPSLYKWCTTQRMAFRRGTISPTIVVALREIKFNFTPRMCGSPEDISHRMACLTKFRAETGRSEPSKSDANKEYVALAQWLGRMRRRYAGGTLEPELATLLIAAKVRLELSNDQRTQNAWAAEEKSFTRNFTALSDWLTEVEEANAPRDLAYRNIKNSKPAEKAYRFIEHMVQKASQGVLSDEHRVRLNMLNFTVNGKPLEIVLNPGPSQASPEGFALTRARSIVKLANEEARQAADQAEEARRLANAARDRAEALNVTVREEIRDITKAQAVERAADNNAPATRLKALEPAASAVYLTTDELAERIKYDARTIRERLLPHVFIEHRHYCRPFGGRKILYIWANIEADMLAGRLTFKS